MDGSLTSVGSFHGKGADNQPKLRRPLMWEVVKELDGCAAEWGG